MLEHRVALLQGRKAIRATKAIKAEVEVKATKAIREIKGTKAFKAIRATKAIKGTNPLSLGLKGTKAIKVTKDPLREHHWFKLLIRTPMG